MPQKRRRAQCARPTGAGNFAQVLREHLNHDISATSDASPAKVGQMRLSDRAIEATEATDADRADGRRPTQTDDATARAQGWRERADGPSEPVLVGVAEHVAESVRRVQAEPYRATDGPDRLVWNLARRILAHDEINEANAYDELVRHCPRWFDAWGIAEDEAEFAMLEALEAVIYPHGCGPLELAARHASERPLRLRNEHRKGARKSRVYERMLGLARALQEQMGEASIYLPARRVGTVLGVPRMTAWRCIKLATADRILVLVREHEFSAAGTVRRAARWRLDLERLNEMTAAEPTPLQRDDED